jgi:hypothetical protein
MDHASSSAWMFRGAYSRTMGRSTIILSLAVYVLVLGPGCAGLSPATAPSNSIQSRQENVVKGDFNDVDAVVAGILPKFHIIEIPQASDNSDIRRFNLRMLNDAPGTLVFEKLLDGQIEIRCALGRFPHPELEKKLIKALAERFEQLRGDVAAPINLPEQ